MQFEFYVLNYDFNRRKVYMYNIFNNISVQEWTEKAVKKYLRSPKKFTYKPFNPNEEEYDMFIGFSYNGKGWNYSLRSTKVDCSQIAMKYGGGGHKGASGFNADKLLF